MMVVGGGGHFMSFDECTDELKQFILLNKLQECEDKITVNFRNSKNSMLHKEKINILQIIVVL